MKKDTNSSAMEKKKDK
jgi:actin-related protein